MTSLIVYQIFNLFQLFGQLYISVIGVTESGLTRFSDDGIDRIFQICFKLFGHLYTSDGQNPD